MLAYSTYGEAGGPGKTTLAASLAAAHARRGRDVLAVDLDPQDAGLSYLLDVNDRRGDPDADHLVRHLRGDPKGPFDGLLRSVEGEGFDVVPAHNALSRLDSENVGHTALRDVIAAANVPDHYEVLICDPPATEGSALYNALAATGSLVIPAEATAKGVQSIRGLEDLAAGFERVVGVSIGVLAVVPNKVDRRSGTQRDHADALRDMDYPTPVELPIRGALFDGAWGRQCTPFRFVDEYRERPPDRERDTLRRVEELAATLEREAGL